ncbi:peptidoglycan recognition protein family protein [Streptomyces chryseus]|uniref:peptidoglycan recognition protein family protein n=1 Tax=Streptomyces chryseus TaxID=68186 RepID=UPI00110F7DFD|nr:N-acetylmuramoyl-L-alanine amidase [Streptomyces chryseus]GGX26911.1 hypothetical protein GCM10010353_47610 [Streptomyces chryseus]
MATPMTADEFVKALKDEGVDVHEYKDWRTHNRNHRGPWGPVHGVMIHHTVSAGTENSVALCYNGHSTLPGPLCHSVGAKDGRVFMVGNGRANHAGNGDDDVLGAVLDERKLPADDEANTDGNRHFYGIELVNLGDGKDPYPPAQYDAAVRWAAGICRKHGWTSASVIGHREWQPGKIDPVFSMDTFRADVDKRLAKRDEPKPPTKPTTPTKPPAKPAPKPPIKPAKPVVDLSNLRAAAIRDPSLPQGGTTHPADVKIVEAALVKEGLLPATYKDGSFGTRTRTAYANWQRRSGVGRPYDGIPGLTSLTKLGARYGFTVKA